MSYLLDTCVLSEFTRKRPEPRVLDWLRSQPEDALFLSVVVLGELAKEIAQLDESPKKRRLRAWLYTDLCARFRGRVLSVTEAVALEWGSMSGRAARAGVQIGVADGLIGATACAHSLVVVTRNVADISATGAPVLNPWTDLVKTQNSGS